MSDEPIVISKDEANSRHVDDLIRRQMSLRGEGITTDTRRRWFYQNWLVFMLVGGVFAAVGWLIIEPWFDDLHYTQGSIEAIDLNDSALPNLSAEERETLKQVIGAGNITVRGQRLWLAPVLQESNGTGIQGLLDETQLRVGQEIGVYADYASRGREEIAIAQFIDLHPPTPATGKGLIPLRDQNESSSIAGFLLFSTIAAMIGLGIGAADGIVCRLPRRAALGGAVGFLVGAVGALFTTVLASAVYVPLTSVAESQMNSSSAGHRALGFFLQMAGRMLAWAFAGMAMGLGQGIALRSKRLLIYGFLGGILGGLLGGLLFDPLDLVILGQNRIGADLSRAVGLVVIGCAVGAMIGVVELLTRDAWLRMTEGPLAGKEFLIFRDIMKIGASPKSEIYLFNDDAVAPTHATLRIIGDETELSAFDRLHPLMVNQSAVMTARLRHGDRITIGSTSFTFEQRQR